MSRRLRAAQSHAARGASNLVPRCAARLNVVCHGALATQRAVVAERRRAGERSVRAQHAAAADVHVVPDLHQVVDLGTRANNCIWASATVNCRIGTNFNVIFDDNPA